jgi:hypothetical protein
VRNSRGGRTEGNLQLVVVLDDVLPQSLETARRRAETVFSTLLDVDLKYVLSFVPDDAADAAEDASLAQLESAVRTALSLLPVQLEPIAVRLTMALATCAA